MNLYRKNGGSPQQLPELDYDVDGVPWTNLANNPEGLVACGWAPAPEVTYDPANQRIEWVDGAWLVSDLPPPVLPEQPPRRIAKIEFWRRFTPAEQVAMLGARKQIAAMSPADFALIENAGWWTLAVVFQEFDLATEYIEPDHPHTLQGMQAFAAANLITEDRIPELLA